MSDAISSITCLCERKIVLWLLLLALTVRVIVWCGGLADAKRYLEPDSKDYLRLAELLSTTGRYGTPEAPEIFRVPGYPLFLSALMKISPAYAWPVFVQLLVDAVLCILVWQLALKLFSSSSAMMALAFQSFSVVSIVYAAQLLSDSLYAFLFVAFLAGLWHIGHGDNRRRILPVTVGIVLTAMAYLRAITIPYLILPTVFLLVRKRYAELVVIMGTVFVLVAPWYMRNDRLAGFPHFSSVGFINLYRYNACLVLAHNNQIPFSHQQAIIDAEFGQLRSQPEIARYAHDRGKAIIAAQPFQYARLHLSASKNNFLPADAKLVQMLGKELGGRNTLSVLHSQGLIAGISHFFHGQWLIFFLLLPTIVALLCTYGLTGFALVERLVSGKIMAFELLLVLSLCYFLLVPGGAAHPRFRVPAAPIFSLYAGYGFALLWHNYFRQRK